MDTLQSANKSRWRDRTRALEILGFTFLCFILYLLLGSRPLVAQPWQWADDGLFLEQGERLAKWLKGGGGAWFGPYDVTIVSKPPSFAAWLACISILGVPLRVAEFALMCALPWLFRRALRPVIVLGPWAFLASTLLLVGMPALGVQFKLLRDGLQAILAGGTLIAVLGVLMRADQPARTQVKWAALAGFLWSAAYLNREESLWLAPGLMLALGTGLVVSLARGRRWRALLPSAACMAAAGSLVLGTCALNKHYYGFFLTSSRRGPQLERLYRLLTSLEPGGRIACVPVRTETREKLYKLSPAFARLQPYLEGPGGDEFALNPGHLSLYRAPEGTREFYVSTFEWALLRAAAAAGSRTVGESELLYGAAAGEIEAAVRAGNIEAGNRSFSLSMAAAMPGDAAKIMAATWRSMRQLLTLDAIPGAMLAGGGPSSGAPADLARMSHLTHMRVAPVDVSMKPKETVAARMRTMAVRTYFFVLRIAYPALAVFTACIGAWALWRWWRSPALRLPALGAVIVAGSLTGFCLIMGMMDTLAMPLLQYAASYNTLGFTPMSVLAAYGVALVCLAVSHNRLQKQKAESKAP